MIALKKLFVPEDSPLYDIGQLNVPFPPSPNQSEDKAKETEEAEDKKDVEAKVVEKESETATGAKSLTLNDQVQNLTEEDEDEVSKSTLPKKANTSKTKITAVAKSLDQTLLEINDEIAAEKSTKLSVETEIMPTAEVEQSEINAQDLST
ncbi:hypothetical protein CsSME_00039297 [Camellia sinensis var. sinensis]